MTVLSRSVGVQTQNMFFASDVSTQTTFLNVIYSFAENLSDWVISEAFQCGRDVEKFANCIADFILLEVFMEKSLNNLTSYIEECVVADRPYCCCVRNEKNDYFSSSEALRNLNDVWSKYNRSEKEHHHSCIFKNFSERFADWEYDKDDDDNVENRSTNSSPDPLQILEDDIIKCLQTLTDDEEELFSEISYSPHHHLNQSSEIDSGFLSSEDNFSGDRKVIQNRKTSLPILNEGLENSSNFAWPEFNISPQKKQEDENSVTVRQKFLKTLLIQEFKEKIEQRKNPNHVEIVYDVPVGPTFKAQATKAKVNLVWSPDRSTFSEEREHMSEGLSNSEKSENMRYFIQNEISIDQIDLCDENRRNGNNVNNMEKKTENIQSVTEKSILINSDPSTKTCYSVLNSKPINKEDTVNEKSINDSIQQDTYYAIPYDRIITTKTIVKAPTYEGIGPTENGLPIGLRTAVKKEHSSEWYKTMFKSLHKCDDDQDLKVQTDGYMSDSELNRKDKSSSINIRNKMTLSNSSKEESSNETNKTPHLFPSAKSSLQTYNHKPWIISDYEPGFSSISNNENLYTNARFLPPLISPKPKYVYNDGYDSDSTLVRKTGKSHTLDLQEQKRWYKKIQKGEEITLPGLCKPAVQKPQDPIIGPPPPMPANWDADHYYKIYTSQTENFPTSVHSPVAVDKTLEKNKQILQDDFRSKLDEVLLNQHGVNTRQSSVTSPNRFSSDLLQHDISNSSNKVVILYDFIAQTSRELSLKKGDVVNIQRIIDKNWYEGNIDGKTGIFPISYAEPISSKSLQRLSKKYINGWARAKYNFTAKNQVELTLNKDDIVSLIREVDNNWYEGNLNGKSGIFPISYVEIISDPDCSVPKASQSSSSSSMLSLAKNERNELDINKNNIKNIETAKIEKVIPVSESFSPKKNFTTYEYNNNKVSPYQALYAYKPQNDDELELKEGDVVYVIEKCDDGWFVGTSMRTGLFGTFPGNYIEKI